MPQFYFRPMDFFPELKTGKPSPFSVKLEVDSTQLTLDIVMLLVVLAFIGLFLVAPAVLFLSTGGTLGQ